MDVLESHNGADTMPAARTLSCQYILSNRSSPGAWRSPKKTHAILNKDI